MIHSNSGKLVGVLAGLAMAVLGTAPFVFGGTCGFLPSFPCCNTVASNSGFPVQCLAPANTKYEFTLNRFCFGVQGKPLACSGTPTAFNAASISVGADLGNYIAGVNVPGLVPGDTIEAMRPEVSKTFTVNGGGQAEHTTTDAVACSSGGEKTVNLSSAAPLCSNNPDELCETSDGFLRVFDTSLGNILFTNAGLTVQFNFEVDSGLFCSAGGGGPGTCPCNSLGPLKVQMSLP